MGILSLEEYADAWLRVQCGVPLETVLREARVSDQEWEEQHERWQAGAEADPELHRQVEAALVEARDRLLALADDAPRHTPPMGTPALAPPVEVPATVPPAPPSSSWGEWDSSSTSQTPITSSAVAPNQDPEPPQSEAAHEPARAPSPNQLAPAGAPRPLLLEHLAYIDVLLARHPEQAIDTLRRHGFDPTTYQQEDARWQQRFASEPLQINRYRALVEFYRRRALG